MPRPLSLALPPLCCAVLLLTLAAQTYHQARAGQSRLTENPEVKPVYWLTPQSNFSKEPISYSNLIMLRARIQKQLGQPRCLVVSKSQAEIEKDIEKDGKAEALYIEVKLTQKKPRVVLWARWKEYEGKIAEFACDPATGERCVELALSDFPTDISNHDEKCHRGKPCRVDEYSMFIVQDLR